METNRQSFNRVFFEYRILVYNLALHYVTNAEDAEEVTQDVFVKMHQSLHKFAEQSSIKTWIYRITVNCCLDFIKHKNSKKRFFIFGRKHDDEKQYAQLPDFEHPGIILENKETAKVLFAAISELTENQKTAFILSKVEGLGNQEISQVMELSISSVESLLFRAKKTLQDKLAVKFDEYSRKK